MAHNKHPGKRSTRALATVAVLAICFSAYAQKVPPERAALGPEGLTSQAIHAGETKWFSLALQENQFVHIVVQQRGIDLEVALTDPKGAQLARMDSPNSESGPEPLVAVASVSGVYGIRVTAPPGVPPGKFDIAVVALRRATPSDSNHVAAERAVEHAYDLGAQQSAGALEKSISELKRALEYYQNTGDPYRLGIVLLSIGLNEAQANRFADAAEYYKRSLVAFDKASDQHMQTMLMSNLGTAYEILGDYPRALSIYERALPMAQAAQEPYNQALVLNNIGEIHITLGEWQSADQFYARAVPLARALGERQLLSSVLHNSGAVRLELGQPELALPLLQEELSVTKTLGDDLRQARTLDSLGYAYTALGDYSRATDCFQQALELQTRKGDKRYQALTLRSLSVIALKQRRPEEALQSIQRSLELLHAGIDPRSEALSRQVLAETYTQSGRFEESLAAYQQARSTFSTLRDANQEAKTLAGMARVQARQGEMRQALANSRDALKLVEGLRRNAGSQQDRTSFFASRQDFYTAHIDLLTQMEKRERDEGYSAEAFQTAERARARSLLEMLSESRVDFHQGVDPKLLQREHDLSEQMNSRSQRLLTLRGAGTEEKAASLKRELNDLESEYQQVELAIRKSSPEYAAITQPQPLTLKEVQQQVLDSDSMLLEYSLGEERSYLFAVSQNGLKTYELPPRAEIDGAVRRVHELLTARSQYKFGETAQEKQARIAKADQEFPAAAAALSKMVLPPASADLAKNEKRLVLVADGALQTVPFAVLPVPGASDATPLVAQHEIVSLPSASTVDELRKQIAGRKPAPGLVAVFADPVFAADDPRVQKNQARAPKEETVAAAQATTAVADESRMLKHLASGASTNSAGRLEVPRLPFTREEATRITKMIPAGESFEALDFKASLQTVNSSTLGKYRYLHFATHGYLDTERPELSSIVLSLVDPNGRPQDGFLRAQDIYNLKLNADLVVLSACETGLGKEIRGEGIVGLTRGFMYAGAPRVIVSMWSVNDRATEELMGAFYERLLKRGMRPSAALRQAQLEMWKSKKWSAPYYWGAFVQQGEWR